MTAVRATKCLAMDRAAFLRLLGPLSEMLERNMELYSRYASGGVGGQTGRGSSSGGNATTAAGPVVDVR